MEPGETFFLTMVLIGFVSFAATLAFVSRPGR